MFEKTVVKAYCGDSFTAITTTDHLVHTFGFKTTSEHQVTSNRLVRLSTDNQSLMYVYARSLSIMRQATSDRPETKQRVSLASETDDLKVRAIYPVTASKIVVVVDKPRDTLTVKGSPNDDTISQRSTVSAIQKHEPVNVADRFLKQVMKIGKIGAINFQTFDLDAQDDSEPTSAVVEEKKVIEDSDEEIMSIKSFSVTNYSQMSSEAKSFPFQTLTG